MLTFGLHSTRDLNTVKWVQWRPPAWLWGWNTWCTRQDWELGFFSLEKETTSSSYCCVQLPREDGARLFLEVYSEKTRGMRQVGTREVLVTYKDFFFLLLTINMTKYYDRLLGEVVESPSLKILKIWLTRPWAMWSNWICSEQSTKWPPFQPKLFNQNSLKQQRLKFFKTKIFGT